MPRHTILPNPRLSPRFAGLCTMCRYPRLEDVLPESRPLDWLVYGVPHDAGVTYRPGARFGPRAIRDASQYVKRYHVEHDVDVCERLSIADAGDAPVKPYELEATLVGVATWAIDIARAASRAPAKSPKPHTTKLLALGGDHSIAYANLRATWELQGKPKGGLALVHFDSHLDTVDSVWGERWGHASPFRRAIEDGLIDPRRMLSVGIKGPLNTKDDLAFAKEHGIRIVTPRDVSLKGDAPLRAFIKSLKGTPCSLTFDIDVIDPAFAPGTGTPCPGGFTTSQAFDLLRSLKGINLVGVDVVEVLPDRDVSGITAFAAAHVAFEALALAAI